MDATPTRSFVRKDRYQPNTYDDVRNLGLAWGSINLNIMRSTFFEYWCVKILVTQVLNGYLHARACYA